MTYLRLTAVVLLFTASTALAQSPTVRVTAQPSTERPVSGETFRIDVTVANNLTQNISNLLLSVRTAEALLTGVSTSGRCGPAYTRDLNCYTDNIPAGGSWALRFEVRVSNSAPAANFVASLLTFTTQGPLPPLPPDRTATLALTILRAVNEADLKVRLAETPSTIPAGERFESQVVVSNAGPATASGVLAVAIPGIPERMIAELDPRCTIVEYLMACRAGSIAAGESTTFRYVVSAVSEPMQITRQAEVSAERLYDPDPSDNAAVRLVPVGYPATLTRVLLPVIAKATPGAQGSRWEAELSVFVDTDIPAYFLPLAFECQILCPPITIDGGFAPARRLWKPTLLDGNPGYLLRFDAARGSDVSLALRVRDLSRDAQDWGTELPVVRDADLRTRRIHLLDIPFDGRFRQTLRIYDPDASGSSSVRIRVYGTAAAEMLLLEKTVALSTSEQLSPTLNLGLPIYPGSAQLDLGSEISRLSEWRNGRIEVESLTSGLRFWAFVSVTNNITQHVTIVTPRDGL